MTKKGDHISYSLTKKGDHISYSMTKKGDHISYSGLHKYLLAQILFMSFSIKYRRELKKNRF